MKKVEVTDDLMRAACKVVARITKQRYVTTDYVAQYALEYLVKDFAEKEATFFAKATAEERRAQRDVLAERSARTAIKTIDDW